MKAYDSQGRFKTTGTGGGGGGAPANAAYITQTPDATLTNEQALSALATGLLKNTTGTGVLSIGVAGTDFQGADATLTALAAYNTNGLITQTAADTFTGRTITGTANQVIVGNGDGVAGNPTLSTPQDIHTAATPQFARLGLGAVADGTALLNLNGAMLTQDASNVLAQRNSTNAQILRVYNTFTDAANYERGFFRWNTNVLEIGVEVAGTGTSRALQFLTANTARWIITTAGHLIASTDGVYDIGQSGANRPQNLWLAGGIVAGAQITTFASIRFSNNGGLNQDADGVATFYNNAATGFDRLQLGGTSSSFPCLKRSTTTLQIKLADDSAFTLLESLSLKTQAPSGGTSGTWKLGIAAVVSPTAPNRTIEVDIGGTIYYLHAKTTND